MAANGGERQRRARLHQRTAVRDSEWQRQRRRTMARGYHTRRRAWMRAPDVPAWRACARRASPQLVCLYNHLRVLISSSIGLPNESQYTFHLQTDNANLETFSRRWRAHPPHSPRSPTCLPSHPSLAPLSMGPNVSYHFCTTCTPGPAEIVSLPSFHCWATCSMNCFVSMTFGILS